MRSEPLAVAVLASGRGSNVEALLACARDHPHLLRVCAVLSDRAEAPALEKGRAAGAAAEHLDPRDWRRRRDYDLALAERLQTHGAELVALAGFMRVLDAAMVQRFAGRMLNIHPSLLPRHPGLHTHRKTLAAGEREHGATVHFVTAELDAGPRVLQYRLGVYPWDDEASLGARVLRGEHRIYPQAVRWFAEGRLRSDGQRAWLDGSGLPRPLQLTDDALAAASTPGAAQASGNVTPR